MPSHITITTARALLQKIAETGAHAVLSIEHPLATGDGRAPRLLAEHGISDVVQLVQVYWDTETPHPQGPSFDAVATGLSFLLREGRHGPVIVHCRQGKARSVAMALAYLVAANPDCSIADCIAHLKTIRPQAAPNILVIRHADRALNLHGRLEQAVLDDALFTANRAEANASRALYAEKNPTALTPRF